MSVDLVEELGPTSFPFLLHSACANRETGVLVVRRGETEKSVYIRDGRIVFATSNDRDDRLGPLLLRRGLVGAEQLDAAAESSLREGKRLGRVLVESGALQPDDLVRGVVEQVREILFSLFEWTSGRCHLTLGDLPSREVITLNVNTGQIMIEGIRRVRSWYRILEAVGSLDTPYRQVSGLEDVALGLGLAEEELSLLTALERPASLRELCRWSSLPDFEVGRLLWGFAASGLVRRGAAQRGEGAGG